ncbi:MAG: FAD-dependent oxidoreductase, partial [Clostridia bacterium]|nr:FAD-dependent oxidoreductase [Clostridia bacterium]
TAGGAAGIAASSALVGCAQKAAAPSTVPEKWDKEVDVVVCGSGFAGMAAAITATEAGAKVLILEKATEEHQGGNSKVSGNMWWTPTDFDGGFAYVKALAYGTTDDESLKALVQEMLKLNDWLSTKFGVQPAPIGGLFQPEHPELPGAESVRTWGNEGKTLASQLYIPIRAYVDQ